MLEKLEGQGHVYGLDIDSIEIEKTTQRLRNKDLMKIFLHRS